MSFDNFYLQHFELINRELGSYISYCQDSVKDEPEFIRSVYGVIKDSALNGGKRLRPAALIMAYQSSGGKDLKSIINAAIAIELHQAYSLILDDIMDEDEERRGYPSAYKRLKDYFLENFKETKYDGSLFGRKSSRFAVSQSVMAANLTLILSKKALLKSGFPDRVKTEAFSMIEDYDESIYHGQMMDVLMEHKASDENGYISMIMKKTASFFAMALELGTMLAGSGPEKRQQFRDFGMASAAAFQLQDDLLDLEGGKGHAIGSDIRKGKKTLLYMKAYASSGKDHKKILDEGIGNFTASDSHVKKIISIFNETGAVDYCREKAAQYRNMAKRSLDAIKLDPFYHSLFLGMNDFMSDRKR